MNTVDKIFLTLQLISLTSCAGMVIVLVAKAMRMI